MSQFDQYRQDVATALSGVYAPRVDEMVKLLERVRYQQATVYVIGNGGSAATASHFANDLLKMCGVRALALTDLSPTVLAYGNDHGWDQMFAMPLRRLLQPMDCVVAISCSGDSPNVAEAMRMVKTCGLPSLKSIVLTGADVNCRLAKIIPDVIVYVPFKDIRVQEDCHLVICHAVAGALRDAATQT